MSFRPRDARGRYIPRETWALAYQLAGERVPARVGKRNQSAPLSLAQVDQLTRKRKPRAKPIVAPIVAPKKKAKPAKAKAPAKRIKPAAPPAPVGDPPGTEYELTARYKGAGRSARATLHVKIRVVTTAHMTQDQARALVVRAMQTGDVSPGIEIHWIDWRRGIGGSSKEGRLDDPNHNDLRAFYAMSVGAGAVRFARATDEEE